MAKFDQQDFLRRLERLSKLTPEQQQAETIETLLKRAEPDEARALRLCAIPHEFDFNVFSALLQGQTPSGPNELFAKVGASPLVRDRSEGVRALTDWARAYLFKQWLDPSNRVEFAAASKRLHQYYKGRALEAARLAAAEAAERGAQPVSAFGMAAASMFHQLGAEPEKGFAVFRQLQREKRRAHRLGDCEFLIRLVHEYDSALTRQQSAYLRYSEGKLALDRRNLEEAARIFTEVLGADAGPENQVRALLQLGAVAAERRQWPKAIAHYLEARRLLLGCPSDSPDSLRLKHRSLQALGVAYRESGSLTKAEKYLNRAARYAYRQSDKRGVAISLNSLGTLYRQLGEYRRAVREYRRGLLMLDKSHDLFQRAQVFNNIGMAYLDLRRWGVGVAYFERSIKIKLAVGDTAGVARSYNNLVRAYRNMPLVPVTDGPATQPAALDANEPAVADEREGEFGTVAASAAVLGSVKAVQTARHSLRLFREVHDYYEAGVASRNLGRLYRRLGRKQRALVALQWAEDLFRRSDPTRVTPEAKAVAEEIKMLKRGWMLPVWLWVVIALVIALLTYSVVALRQGRW